MANKWVKEDPNWEREDAEPPPKSWWDTGVDYAKGAAKGAMSTLTHIGELGIDIGNPYPKGSKEATFFDQVRQGQKDMTNATRTPSNEDQRKGFSVEQTAEYFIPGVDELLPEARIGAGIAQRVLSSSAKGALRAAPVGAAQTGSVQEGLKQGATNALLNPATSETARFVTPLLKKAAQRAYERFIIPGGGPNFNKEVAKTAAEEFIKRGEMALTRDGFVRSIEERLFKSHDAVKKAEDEALERLGYSPTGRNTYNVHVEDFQVADEPPITVDPIPPRPTPHKTGLKALPKNEAVVPSPTETGLTTRREVGFPERGVTKYQEPTTESPNYRTYRRVRVDTAEETRKGLIDIKPVLQKLNHAQSEGYVEGTPIQGYQQMLATRKRLINQIRNLSTPNGHMNALSVIRLRRSWDELLNWEVTADKALPPGAKRAYEDATNALRHEIGEQVPGMREANAEYHFFMSVNKVLKDKENAHVGHRLHGLLGNIAIMGAGAAGYHYGGGGEAAALVMLTGLADSFLNSGAKLTVSAVALDRAASLMSNGKFTAALSALGAAASTGARSDNRDNEDSDQGDLN